MAGDRVIPSRKVGGELITLRRVTLADAEVLYALVYRNRKHLEQWGQNVGQSYLSVEMTRWRIKNTDKNKRRFGIWGEVSGLMGVIHITLDEQGDLLVGDIGYWMSQEFGHRGIMSEACGMLVAWAEVHVDPHMHFTADTAKKNTFSQKVLAKNGFVRVYEGREKFYFEREASVGADE